MFKVSYHAGERFLQRVLGVYEYSKKDVINAINMIKTDIMNIVSPKQRFILPSFNKFNVVVENNTVVTVVPKSSNATKYKQRKLQAMGWI